MMEIADCWRGYSCVEMNQWQPNTSTLYSKSHISHQNSKRHVDSRNSPNKNNNHDHHHHHHHDKSNVSHGGHNEVSNNSSSASSSTSMSLCSANEALCSLNLAHYYFLQLGENASSEQNDTINSKGSHHHQNSSVYHQDSDENTTVTSNKLIELIISHTKRAARYGIPVAWYNLGMLCLWKYYKDEMHAVKYLRKASQLDYIPAHYHLALLIKDGLSCAVKNDQEVNKEDICKMNSLNDNRMMLNNQTSNGGGGENNVSFRMNSTTPGNKSTNAPLLSPTSSQSSHNSSKTTVINYDATTTQLKLMGLQTSLTKKGTKSSSEKNKTRALYLLLTLVLRGFRDSCLDAGLLLSRGILCPLNKEMKLIGLKKNVNCWHRAFIIWCKGAKLGCTKCTHQIGYCYKRGRNDVTTVFIFFFFFSSLYYYFLM